MRGFLKDDPYQVNNFMHNIPMQEGGEAPSLTVLAKAIILGKHTNHIHNFVN